MGLQVVNAVRATETLSVLSSYPKGSSIPSIDIAGAVPFGSVVPRPPLLEYSATSFGSPISASFLDVSVQGTLLYTQSWKDALDLGGLADAAEAHTYALVVVGPRPGTAAGGWWNATRIAALATTP
jgi:hypothetical protein